MRVNGVCAIVQSYVNYVQCKLKSSALDATDLHGSSSDANIIM
jgi:hypothetical protein